MTETTRIISGIIILTIPSIAYGGYFLLRVLTGNMQQLQLTPFQKAMFRAGHAHAGVIVILSLVVQLLADHAILPSALLWITRLGVPLSAILISGGFFGAALGKGANRPNRLILLLYTGAGVLVLSLILLGIGLIRE